MWRAERKIPDGEWQRTKGMDAEVAECDYAPKGWPEGTRTLCRRVKVTAAERSSDPRSRRRRTIYPNQLSLLTSGEAAYAYAYSFIITNLPGDIVDIEAWFRMRALVEEKIKDSKLGAGDGMFHAGPERLRGRRIPRFRTHPVRGSRLHR